MNVLFSLFLTKEYVLCNFFKRPVFFSNFYASRGPVFIRGSRSGFQEVRGWDPVCTIYIKRHKCQLKVSLVKISIKTSNE